MGEKERGKKRGRLARKEKGEERDEWGKMATTLAGGRYVATNSDFWSLQVRFFFKGLSDVGDYIKPV